MVKKAGKPARLERDGSKANPARPARSLDALREPVLVARARFEAVYDEAKKQVEQAVEMMSRAGHDYREALAPYREACRKAGVKCEFEGGRPEDVKPNLIFIVDKVEKGVRVMLKGKPGSEEVIPFAALKASVNRAAYAYTDKHLGPREKVGDKGGTLI
jgi:hypothetical protein